MHGELAELAAESHERFGRDVLLAENDDLVLHECRLHGGELLGRKRLSEIDAGDLGAEAHTDPRDRDTGTLRRELPKVDDFHGFSARRPAARARSARSR